MDVANLISQPGPDPTKARTVYSTPAFKASSRDDKSYFTPVYSRSQPPLSPPVEDHQPKCSLPSISTLFEGADSAAMQPAKRQRISSPDSRPQSRAFETTSTTMASVPVCLPPTPPLRPGSSFHRASSHSPSASSVSATSDKTHHYQKPQIPVTADRTSISSQGSAHAGPYASPAPSVASYASPVESSTTSAAPSTTTVYYQRPAQPMAAPAPAASAPTPAAAAAAAAAHHQQMISPVTPAWQHHHYFPPSNATPYQQNHDRYVCRTCHKAFSRPSSLRIHSHSHTGEKPFRCTHAGCGKAFSVRSNMKRHERGCHTGRPVATAVV